MSINDNQTPDKVSSEKKLAKQIRQTRKQAAFAGCGVFFVVMLGMFLIGVFIVGPDSSTRTAAFIVYCSLTIPGIGMTYWFFDARLDYNKLLSDATQESER